MFSMLFQRPTHERRKVSKEFQLTVPDRIRNRSLNNAGKCRSPPLGKVEVTLSLVFVPKVHAERFKQTMKRDVVRLSFYEAGSPTASHDYPALERPHFQMPLGRSGFAKGTEQLPSLRFPSA